MSQIYFRRRYLHNSFTESRQTWLHQKTYKRQGAREKKKKVTIGLIKLKNHEKKTQNTHNI